jgi:hypothetical protein
MSMKNIFKLFTLLAALLVIFAGCNGSRGTQRSMHNHGVDNRGFKGY